MTTTVSLTQAEFYREFLMARELRFCGDVRRKYGYYDLPDDAILKSIMNRRKSQ